VGRGTQSGDHADISAGAAQVASLTAKAMQSTEVRQNKVNALAAAVSSGSYEVPAEKAAEAMVSEMLARASVIR
jgi:flagellar biosynthesis anti-sigma factor FlgM